MRSVLTRAAVVAAVLLVAAPAVAGAAVDEYAAEASTSSVKVAAFEESVGSPLLDLVSTDAFASSDPTASASVGGLELLGEEVFPVVEATSDGAPDRDPAEGDGCVVEIPGLEAVCAVASADAGPSDEATANATTRLLEVSVDGDLLKGALSTPIGDLVTNVGDLVLEGVTAEFLAQCNAVIASIDEEARVTQTARDLLGMLPEELDRIERGVSEAVGNADEDGYCTAVFNLTAGDITEQLPAIDGIIAALPTEGLVDLDVDSAVSDVAGAEGALTATATQTTVTLSGVDFGSAALDEAITAVVGAIVEAVEDLAGADAPPIPEQFDLEAIFDQIPLFGIEGPLFSGEVFGGMATATLDTGDASTTSGGTAPFIEVNVLPGVLALLGQDPQQGTIRLESGESQTIAEGTPLESTFSVGAFSTEDDATFEDTDLTGSTSTASATTVSLLNIPEAGGIEVALAESTAGVYAATATAGSPAPPTEKDLPNTGGGAALAAAVAIGGALALRRRRD